jgi:hypothetical protein
MLNPYLLINYQCCLIISKEGKCFPIPEREMVEGLVSNP